MNEYYAVHCYCYKCYYYSLELDMFVIWKKHNRNAQDDDFLINGF